PEATVRGRARRPVAVRAAHRAHSRCRPQATRLHPRRVYLWLRARAIGWRSVSRAGSPARIPVGRLDHGHATVGAVDACGHRAHGGSLAQGGGAADMMEIAPL